jgi:hypothetical protein
VAKKSVNIRPLLQWNKGQILTLFFGHPVQTNLFLWVSKP